jgi:hypothetical protein
MTRDHGGLAYECYVLEVLLLVTRLVALTVLLVRLATLLMVIFV